MTKALQKTREERYQTATDFMHDLQDVAGSSRGESPRPPAVHQVVEVFGVRTEFPGHATFVDDTLDVEDEAYQHAVPLAGTTKQPATGHIEHYSVRFDAELLQGCPWVAIDEIAVVVTSFRQLSPYRPSFYRGFQESHLYTATIDRPLTVPARFVATGPLKDRLGLVRLKAGEPEAFAVQISARTRGIYDFSVRMLTRYRDRAQEIVIIEKTTCAFDSPSGSVRSPHA